MCYADLSYSRPDLSIFALLGLGLGLGLLKTVNQVHFQFPLCTSALFCLGCMTFCQLVSYTQPKISVTYLIVTAELAQGLACSFAIYLSGDNVSSDPDDSFFSGRRTKLIPAACTAYPPHPILKCSCIE